MLQTEAKLRYSEIFSHQFIDVNNLQNQSIFDDVVTKTVSDCLEHALNYRGIVVVADGINNETKSSQFPRPS